MRHHLTGVVTSLAGIAVLAFFALEYAGNGGSLPVSLCRFGHSNRVLGAPTGTRLITTWQLDGVAVLLVVGLAVGYLGMVVRAGAPWSGWRTLSWFVGLALLVVATCSSIGVYDMTLFSVHMLQHLLLIMVAPAFLVAGQPLSLAVLAARPPWERRIRRVLASAPVSAITSPPVVLALYAAVIAGTHLSGIMNQVMQHAWLGQAEHLAYLTTGFLFFLPVVGDAPIRWRLALPGRLMLLVMSMVVDTFVGIILLGTTVAITMVPHPGWGSSPLTDTQTGGAIMWVVGDGLMVVIVLATVGWWFRQPQLRQEGSGGWLEQARIGAFVHHTSEPVGEAAGAVRVTPRDIDDDDGALDAYNDWLRRLST